MYNKSDLREYIKMVLQEDGMAASTASNIASGTQIMDKLSRATRLSKAPYYLSPLVWQDIYKGSNRVEKKN